MVSLSAAASALLLVASDATSLRTEQNRRLSYKMIAGYEPRSQVTDHVSGVLVVGDNHLSTTGYITISLTSLLVFYLSTHKIILILQKIERH